MGVRTTERTCTIGQNWSENAISAASSPTARVVLSNGELIASATRISRGSERTFVPSCTPVAVNGHDRRARHFFTIEAALETLAAPRSHISVETRINRVGAGRMQPARALESRVIGQI